MIQFACPNPKCARRYNADAKHADQRVKCPACQTVLRRVASAQTPVRPPPVIKRNLTEGTTQPPPPLADQASDRIDYVCTHCHVKHRAPTSEVGTTVRCPDCGAQTVVAALLVATEGSRKPPSLTPRSHDALQRKRQGKTAAKVSAEDALVSEPPPAAGTALPVSSQRVAHRDADSDESLRRQQLRILAGQIRRVVLIEESIEQAEWKLRELERAAGGNGRRSTKP